MTNIAKLIGLVIVLLITTAFGQKNSANPSEQIASMRWLAGSWEGQMWGGTFVAYYCTPDGGKVMSYNKLVKEGQIGFHEFEVFEIESGKVVFHPFPEGKKATSLTLATCDPAKKRVVFENPNKDFPTRIEYHRVADDRLHITLSDPHNDSEKVEKFELTRKTQ